MLETVDYGKLRKFFKPSRLFLGVAEDKANQRYNFLPIAFNMICGYKPFSFAVAIHNINHSYELFEQCEEFVLSIPTESQVNMVLESGTMSGKKYDKFKHFNLSELRIEQANSCGIKECKVNIFCKKTNYINVGDHSIVVGEVITMLNDTGNTETNLLSIGPEAVGYKLLRNKGTHYLGVVDRK